MYFLKNKSDVFEKFLIWKAMVEKLSGLKLKVLRSDNDGDHIYLNSILRLFQSRRSCP